MQYAFDLMLGMDSFVGGNVVGRKSKKFADVAIERFHCMLASGPFVGFMPFGVMLTAGSLLCRSIADCVH